MTMDDTALREQARQQIQDTVLSYLRENRHLEHVVDEIMLEVDRIGIALRDAARAEQREADALAVCLQCREALQREAPEAEERNGQWVHVHGPHDWRNCNAAAIRSA